MYQVAFSNNLTSTAVRPNWRVKGLFHTKAFRFVFVQGRQAKAGRHEVALSNAR